MFAKAIKEIRKNNEDHLITLHKENANSYTEREIFNYLKDKKNQINVSLPIFF